MAIPRARVPDLGSWAGLPERNTVSFAKTWRRYFLRHNRLLTRAAPYGADSEPRTSESGCAITYDVLFNDAAIGCPIRISILCHSATFVSTILAPGSTQIANQAFSNPVALLAVAQKRREPGAASRLGLGVY